MEIEQDKKKDQKNGERTKSVIATKIVIVLSILWEMFVVSNSFRVYNVAVRFNPDDRYYYTAEYILTASSPVIVIIGLMWIFGVFRLKP